MPSRQVSMSWWTWPKKTPRTRWRGQEGAVEFFAVRHPHELVVPGGADGEDVVVGGDDQGARVVALADAAKA
jgi:hypothetical protein